MMNFTSIFILFPVFDESLRGGYMLCFLDDGEGMDPSKCIVISYFTEVNVISIIFVLHPAEVFRTTFLCLQLVELCMCYR